jgi:hypothetical protein
MVVIIVGDPYRSEATMRVLVVVIMAAHGIVVANISIVIWTGLYPSACPPYN